MRKTRPPLWSSGQSFWLQIQWSRVRFPALPDFLSSSGSGTGFTQPREVNWGATWIKSSGSGPEKQRLTAVGIRCADYVTPLYPQKLALTSPTGGGRSVGIVRSRTKGTDFFYWLNKLLHYYKTQWGGSYKKLNLSLSKLWRQRGGRNIAPPNLQVDPIWRWLVKLTPRSLWPLGKKSLCTINRRLDGPQNRFGGFGQEKNILPTQGFENRIVQSVA